MEELELPPDDNTPLVDPLIEMMLIELSDAHFWLYAHIQNLENGYPEPFNYGKTVDEEIAISRGMMVSMENVALFYGADLR